MIMYYIILASMIFIYLDATKNNIGKVPNEKRFTNMSAGMWCTATGLLWIVGFPLYLLNRKKLIEKAKEYPQTVSTSRKAIVLGILTIIWVLLLCAEYL